jgi:hypothetical protein
VVGHPVGVEYSSDCFVNLALLGGWLVELQGQPEAREYFGL